MKKKIDPIWEKTRKDLADRLKQNQFESLRWKLFFKYKIIELGILCILGLIGLFIWAYLDVIERFYKNNTNFFDTILPFIIVVIVVVGFFLWINWKVADENAREKLGIRDLSIFV